MKVLAPNTLLQNRYLVVHLIGKGGMGEVYLAVDQRLGSAVALKRTFFSDDEMLGNAFEREARILGRLRHPVLPKVSDHFVENGNQYLVMEHITGDDLSKRLELTQKPFPLSWVLFWADQLMDALWYLHSHEPPIIHRDIKPQNLKLTDENNIILLDFGLSKSNIGESRISRNVSAEATGSVVGYTPHYAPMEQIRGTGTGPRSDLYSLSATLYQLLTNDVPPDALSRADSLLNGSPDPVQPINEVNAEVNKAISDVIIKGMAVSQDLRYTNAREMQKDLRDAYAELQKAMSANTVAFTLPENTANPKPENTEPLFSVPPVVSPDLITETEVPKVSAMQTESLPAVQNEPSDFDQTLHYDGEVQQFDAQQSSIKTEVFSGGILPVEGDAIPTASEAQVEIPQAQQNYSPDATTPLINFDGEKASLPQPNNFDTQFEPKKEEMPSTAMFMPSGDYSQAENVQPVQSSGMTEDFSFTQDFKQEEIREDYNSQPQAMAAVAATAPATTQPQKKSGNGKAFAILGVLGLLLFLGIGAAGFGYWYLYGGGSSTTQNDPTPTPSPSVSPSPTATPDQNLANTDSNTNVNSETNTDVANTNSETNSDTNSETNNIANTDTKIDVVKPTPTQTQVRVTPTPPINRVTPTPPINRVTPTPPIRTPTKTPVKDDSKKILQ